jgi:ribosomal protein S12 methylthiotransferase accessory factor
MTATVGTAPRVGLRAPPADQPWDRSCRTLADLLRRGLTDQGAPVAAVRVMPLGVRDELAADVTQSAAGPAVYLYGQHAIVGPFPGDGAGDGAGAGGRPCSRCLARRWQCVRSFPLREALETGSGAHAAGESPYVTPFAADAVAALITSRQRHPVGPAGSGTVYLVDLETLLVRGYPLVPDPECPTCGRSRPDTAAAARIVWRSTPKWSPGEFRRRGIDGCDIPVEALANPVCGAVGSTIVYDVASTTTSATLGAFTLRSGEYLRETFWGGHADSYHHSARIGVLEGLERSAGMRPRGKTTRVSGSLESLGSDALDPRVCGLYSDQFYRDNPRVVPFSSTRQISWVWGYSLRQARPLLVPEILTYYHAPGLENRFVQESSNGCASGGCLEEAVYFGLMEVIERDAFLLMWYGRAGLAELDPQTSSSATTRQMVDRLAMYGYEARFFDARIGFPVPVVTAAAVRIDGGLGRMCFGAAASLDPEAAMRAALCEIATDAVNARGRVERNEDRLRAMVGDFDRVVGLHDHPLLYGVPEMAQHASFLLGTDGGPPPLKHAMADRYAGLRPPSTDLRVDLERCVDEVTSKGFDVIVVDQTLPEQRDLGLRTASVLVPGLLPIDFGWRRQRALLMPRLRTALREAGLRDRDLRVDELNPAPHPFP